MAVEADKGEENATSPDVQKPLEQRYIALLERRISDLEKQINGENGVKPETPSVPQTPIIAPDQTVQNGTTGDEMPENADKETEISTTTTDGDASTSQPPKKPRVRNVIFARGENSDTWEDREVGSASKPNITGETGDATGIAFTFRRVMSTKDMSKLSYTEVDIHALGLRTFLKDNVGPNYPSQSWEGQVVNMAAPFAPILFNWDKLTEETTVQENDNPELKETREDLAQLLSYLRRADELTAYFKTRDSNRTAKVTTYDTMWTLFAPGTEVVAKPFLNSVQIFRVGIPPDSSPGNKFVYCWGYDWNGKALVKCWYPFRMEKFKGTKEINTLECYPLEYHQNEIPEHEDGRGTSTTSPLRESLIKRGRLFNDLCRVPKGAKQMFDYDDYVLWSRFGRGALSKTKRNDFDKEADSHGDENSSQGTIIPDSTVPKLFKMSGKVIVDAAAFRQFGPGNLPLGDVSPHKIVDPSEKAVESFDVLEESQLLLCPPRLLGYATQEKTWGQFKVESLKVIETREGKSAFDNTLQLDETYKTMVKALVENHSKLSTKAKKDVVKGKGQGLVMLLHGPPGVGKTLTAELIAEHTGKPLLVVSVAEIGLTASSAEKNLDRMFALAGNWEAILLVDEADVFLETRSRDGDANRNALISGIMILTTNRINSLDIAIQSRIHLAIRYDDLKQKDKARIFRYFLDALPYHSRDEREKLKEWIEETGSDYQLNGRQIRNVVSTAHALACSEEQGEDITRDHFKRVTAMTKEFQSQLEKLTMQRRGDNEASGK